MQKKLLTLAFSTFVLGGGIAVAQAQQSPASPMMQQDRPGMMMQQPSGAMGLRDGQSHRRQAETMHGDGPGMMSRMGPGMMTMMMVMMDSDGDGALSLDEVQAVHTRMFNYADADKDGKLTPQELRGFFHGDVFGSNGR